MVDVVSIKVLQQMMAGIRGKNTKPELLVRKILFALGYRFRIHRQDLPGTPDIVMPGRKIVFFVPGCLWHSHACCGRVKIPATNIEFWRRKLNGNMARDRVNTSKLNALGWRTLIVWECATRGKNIDLLASKLSEWIAGFAIYGELS